MPVLIRYKNGEICFQLHLMNIMSLSGFPPNISVGIIMPRVQREGRQFYHRKRNMVLYMGKQEVNKMSKSH